MRPATLMLSATLPSAHPAAEADGGSGSAPKTAGDASR